MLCFYLSPWFMQSIASQTPFSLDMMISIICGFMEVVRWRRSSSLCRRSTLDMPELSKSKWWMWCSSTIQLGAGLKNVFLEP